MRHSRQSLVQSSLYLWRFFNDSSHISNGRVTTKVSYPIAQLLDVSKWWWSTILENNKLIWKEQFYPCIARQHLEILLYTFDPLGDLISRHTCMGRLHIKQKENFQRNVWPRDQTDSLQFTMYDVDAMLKCLQVMVYWSTCKRDRNHTSTELACLLSHVVYVYWCEYWCVYWCVYWCILVHCDVTVWIWIIQIPHCEQLFLIVQHFANLKDTELEFVQAWPLVDYVGR